MTFTKGRFIGVDLHLSEDSEIVGGNWRVTKIFTNGFRLTINHHVHGLTIDGEKDPEKWDSNVTILYPVTEGKDYTFKKYKRDISVLAMRKKLARHRALSPFMFTVVWIHANPEGGYAGWRTAYLEEADESKSDWWFSVDVFQSKLAKFSESSSWSDFTAKVLSRTIETWNGDKTALISEVG